MTAILEGLIKRARLQPRPEDGAVETPEPVTKRRCLLIDDSRVIRKVAWRILEGLAYKVSEAENGEEALVQCRSAMPDLFMVDWNMPVMSGLEFVTSLRGMQGNRRPKVMFCTTYSNTDDIRKGIEAGADEYVIKPFDQQSLHAKLLRIGAA